METRGRHRMGTGVETEAGTGTRTVSGRAEEKRRSTRNPTRVGTGGDLAGKRKQRRQERADSVQADPDNVEDGKETGHSGLK